MSVGEPRDEISEPILAEACGWYIDGNEGEIDAAGRERFNDWLRRSPEHVRAYLEITAAWEYSARLKEAQPSDPAALLLEALAGTNVVPFNPRVSKWSASDPSSVARAYRESEAPAGGAEVSTVSESGGLRWAGAGRVGSLIFAAAACGLVAVGIGFLRQPNAYSTGAGEQRSIMLNDGSTVELNVRSRLRVRFSQTERSVDLLDGQALFEVKKDATRPFIVRSSGTRVEAVGTQFDVYRKATATRVTVVEGRVAVTGGYVPAAGGTAPDASHEAEMPIFLSAGEQLTVSPQVLSHAVPADIDAATAWTQHKLIFVETPLSEAAAEFNRYNSRQIVIEDAALAAYHIRGHFEASDPDRLVTFLRERFDVKVRMLGNEIRISRN